MDCRDCVYGHYSDEYGDIVCTAFLPPCEYDEDEMDELWEDEMDELWEKDSYI